MKKLLLSIMLVAAFAMVTPAIAASENKLPAGKSNTAHVKLMGAEGYEDVWGKVTYNYSGESMDFVMNVKNVEPMTEYVVKSKGNDLGTAMSNPGGNLHVEGSWDCSEDLDGGRVNLRRADNNERVAWSGDEVFDVFTCVAE